jgi:hypothetical protein
MGYFNHFLVNMRISGKCLLLCIFHFIHGLIPCKYTSHEFWGIDDE